jgi:hypothetical protein
MRQNPLIFNFHGISSISSPEISPFALFANRKMQKVKEVGKILTLMMK